MIMNVQNLLPASVLISLLIFTACTRGGDSDPHFQIQCSQNVVGISGEDRQYYSAAIQDFLNAVPARDGSWQNPNSGNSGTFKKPHRMFASTDAICLEFNQTAIVNGQSQSICSTSCKSHDGGSWMAIYPK